MSLSRKIAHNTLMQMAGKIFSTVIGLFSLALITRYLGQSGYGEYTTVITYLTLFAVFGDLGLTLVTVQMISPVTDKNREITILNNLFSFRFVSVVAILAVAPLFLIFMPYSAAVKTGILITAIYFVFPALSQIIVGLLQKNLGMDRAALAELLSRFILLFGIVIVWIFGLGLNGMLIATTLSGGASFLFHYLLARKFAKIGFAWDFSLWKEIISKSWPLAITIVLNLIYLRADIIFLSLFKGEGDVGLYGAAYKVIDVLTTLPFMFAGLVLPLLTAAWAEGRKEYFHKIMQRSFDFMAIIACPLIIGGQVMARSVMDVVAGQEFGGSGAILRLLIIAVAAIFLGTIFSHAVIALDKQRRLIGFYVFTSFSSLIAYLLFIPRFSYFGAAAVTIYSETLIAIFSAYCVYKYSRFKPSLITFFKALAASIIMGIIIWLLPAAWRKGGLGLLTIGFGAIIYVAGLILFRGINKNDLKSIFSKSGGSQAYSNNL